VFNLHEVQDFSFLPSKKTMKAQNTDCMVFFLFVCNIVSVVDTLVQKCKANGISKLVHLSSVYLQCSARWPNVYGRECEDYSKFQSEVPFPVYCESKSKAEQIIQLAGSWF